MSPASIAALILEWWATGERSQERLVALVAHFGEQYRLTADQLALVRAIVEVRR